MTEWIDIREKSPTRLGWRTLVLTHSKHQYSKSIAGPLIISWFDVSYRVARALVCLEPTHIHPVSYHRCAGPIGNNYYDVADKLKRARKCNAGEVSALFPRDRSPK